MSAGAVAGRFTTGEKGEAEGGANNEKATDQFGFHRTESWGSVFDTAARGHLPAEIRIADFRGDLNPIAAGHWTIGDIITLVPLRDLDGFCTELLECDAARVERRRLAQLRRSLGLGDVCGRAFRGLEIVGRKRGANALVVGEEFRLGLRKFGGVCAMTAVIGSKKGRRAKARMAQAKRGEACGWIS